MGRWIFFAAVAAVLGGCGPKMGQDIIIEPEGNLRWENSSADVVLGVLALLGAPVEKEPLKIGSDLKVSNQWHSDMKLVSLSYSLSDGKTVVANGGVREKSPIVIASGSQKTIPLMLRIDPDTLDFERVKGVIQFKRKLWLKGEAVIEVWGMQRHFPFEKDATPLLQKALKLKTR